MSNEKFPNRKGPYMGIKVNENLFTHQHAPVWIAKKQFKEDEDVVQQLFEHKNRYLYEVADVKLELESLTEDEEVIKNRPEKERQVWEIKRDIKIAFKRFQEAP